MEALTSKSGRDDCRCLTHFWIVPQASHTWFLVGPRCNVRDSNAESESSVSLNPSELTSIDGQWSTLMAKRSAMSLPGPRVWPASLPTTTREMRRNFLLNCYQQPSNYWCRLTKRQPSGPRELSKRAINIFNNFRAHTSPVLNQDLLLRDKPEEGVLCGAFECVFFFPRKYVFCCCLFPLAPC